MGGRPYPSTLGVTRTRPRWEEWPCPGSCGCHASWRQCSAPRSAAHQSRQSRQRHIAKLASTRKHAAHGIAEQSKAVPPANKARAQASKAGPGGSDTARPMGGRPYPSASEVTRTRPQRGEPPCPGSRGRHTSWRQHSTQHSAADQSRQRPTMKRASTRQHTTHSKAKQSKVVYRNNNGGQPHHPPRAPTPAQHPTPRVGARPTTRALHPHTATAAHKQGMHVEHHQGPTTPHPNANTAPTTHATTKATLTHTIEGMLP